MKIFTNNLSLKQKIKKQNSAANKNTYYRKLREKFDLVEEMNKLIEVNYTKRIDRLREDFKNNPEDFDLLYPILKLSDPNEINSDDKNALINEIFTQIKKRYSFFYFLSFYNINDNILKKLIPFLIYECHDKENYIYKENEFSTKFYFIIKGSVSFRKKEIFYINDSTSKIEEVEKFILNENKYFGELDLIYDRRKRFSAYCNTDCHFLTIKKENFKKYIEDRILRVENDKKLFLNTFFNNYTNMPSIKLERFIINNVQTLFYKRNEIIYKEGDDNICLYIIYCGEANLIKNINEGEFSYITKFNESTNYIIKKASRMNYSSIINNIKNIKEEEKNNEIKKLDILLNRNEYNIVGNLTKGSIGGLEITTGIRQLKYSLISSSDFTCILKVDLRNIDDYLNLLMLNLLPIFIKLEKNINKRINNIKLIDDSILPLSCKRLKKNKSTPFFEKEEEENDKVYKRHIQKINDNFQLNKGGFIKMNDYNFNLYQQKNYFEDKLKKNKKKNYIINKILRSLEKEEKLNLKYTEFKMNNIISSPKNKKIYNDNNNIKLKIQESGYFTCDNNKNSNLKYKNLKLNEFDFNNKNQNTIEKENNLAFNNLFKITKRTLNIIKNKNQNKKKFSWKDFKTEVKSNKKRIIKKSISNVESIFTKKKNKNKNLNTFEDNNKKLLYIKRALSIDDENYFKNVIIYKSPKQNNKSKYKELFITPNNLKTINFVNEIKNNDIIENKKITKFNNGKKLKIKTNKLLFYNTGNFDIPLLSNLS